MSITLVNIPQSNFVGPFDSVPVPGAIQIPPDCASITCSLDMPAAEQTNALNAVTWSIYVGPTNAGPWTPLYGPESWQGGTHTAHDGTPNVPNSSTFSYGIDPSHRGQFMRAAGNVAHKQTLGCTVVSNP